MCSGLGRFRRMSFSDDTVGHSSLNSTHQPSFKLWAHYSNRTVHGGLLNPSRA